MIRDATEADLPRILAITNDAIATTTTSWMWSPSTLAARETWMRERQARGFPVLIAETDGAVDGFGSFGDFRPWDGYLHTVEHSIYVDPTAQGRGLGKTLLAALIDRARALDMHAMIGGIEAGNIRSIALHLRAGFVETGRLPEVGRKFDRWLDLVFMQKML